MSVTKLPPILRHSYVEEDYEKEKLPIGDEILEKEGEEPGILAVKRTYQPHIKKMKRKHGFLQRSKTINGQKVNKRRIQKGRKYLTV